MDVELLLSEPTWNGDGDTDSAAADAAAKTRINILKKLESILWSLVTSECRSEARLWLCNTISSLTSITPQAQCQVFLKLLRPKPRKPALAAQLLQMIFQKRPHRIGKIIAKKSYILESFFKGNPRRVLQWFDFSGIGESKHKKGARALSQYAFMNRDICWEELEWKGKHGQSPAVVATKPHYFLDLDVQKTVENFLEYVPEFWSSDELAESVKGGEIFLIDTKFFTDWFVDLMYEEDSKEIWEVISDFLLQESFPSLCHHLLLILEERDLCALLNTLCRFLNSNIEPKYVHPSYWLEILLLLRNGCASIDELLLLNAVINQGRQLLRLVRDEERVEERQRVRELVLEISNTTTSISDTALVKECLKMEKSESVKWLGLQSWVLQYRLSEEYETPDSWEALFVRSGINFRKSSSYDLLTKDGFSYESDFDDGGSARARRKKGKTPKKRRRYYDHDDCQVDELVDVDSSHAWKGLQTRAGSWLLSTDNFSSSWDNLDLPEHLAKHCFSTWMKWLCFKWSSPT